MSGNLDLASQVSSTKLTTLLTERVLYVLLCICTVLEHSHILGPVLLHPLFIKIHGDEKRDRKLNEPKNMRRISFRPVQMFIFAKDPLFKRVNVGAIKTEPSKLLKVCSDLCAFYSINLVLNVTSKKVS